MVSDSDSDWPLSDEPLATDNTGFLSDGEVLAFNQPDLITNDVPFSSPDEFSPLYGNAENDNMFSSGDDIIAGEPTELAECSSSSSDLDPAVVKLRMRPRDGSALCKDPNSTPPTDLGQIFDAGRKYLERLLGKDNNNPY